MYYALYRFQDRFVFVIFDAFLLSFICSGNHSFSVTALFWTGCGGASAHNGNTGQGKIKGEYSTACIPYHTFLI